MKPPPFLYAAPATVTDALDLLGEHRDDDIRVIAGGQSLVPLMNFRLAQPTHLVDLNRIDALSGIRGRDGVLAIGAMTRQAAVERSEDVLIGAPLLAEAVSLVAHEPIRHRGTVGGSLAHADPAAELPAAALAMDAEFALASSRGERVVAASDFFRGPFTTALEPDEMLTEIRLPSWPIGTGHSFVEFTRTHGNFAVVGVAALLHLTGDRIDRAAIALCGVGPTAIRAGQAERVLTDAAPTAEVLDAAADAAASGLTPAADLHGDSAFRVGLARTYVRKALDRAVARAQDRR